MRNIFVVACLILSGCATKTQPQLPQLSRSAPPPQEAALAAPSPTKSATLYWDHSPEWPDGVAGYRIYQGGLTGKYTNSFTASGTSLVVYGLVPKSVYYFAATAYNSSGMEGNYSSEVMYRVPGGKVRLTTQLSTNLVVGNWSNIATNYDETDAQSSFYRVLISTEEVQ